MKKITFNKSNWSGEKGTLTIYKNGEFKLYGYRFKLIQIGDQERETICESYKIISADKQWDEDCELGEVSCWSDQNYWTASQYGMTREDPIKEIAAAKLLCNTI